MRSASCNICLIIRVIDGIFAKATKGRQGNMSTLADTINEMLEDKVKTILGSIFNEDIDTWCGVLQIEPSKMRPSDQMNFDNLMRRFRELQRARFENLNKGLASQLTNSIMDVSSN